MGKVSGEAIGKPFLERRTKRAIDGGYTKPRWIEFCEFCLEKQLRLNLYEARETFSKYITVSNGKRSLVVRYSNHKPNKQRELNGDCDFFVGVTHTGARNTVHAIEFIERELLI